MTLPRKPLKIAKLYNCMTLFRTNDRDPVNKSQKVGRNGLFFDDFGPRNSKNPRFFQP